MKRPTRKFKADTLQHIYQRTKQGRLIFYRREDYLFYFTLFSVYAHKYRIKIAKLCLMVNHTHSLIAAESNQLLTEFLKVVTSVFVREYNRDIERSGPLFEKQFGCASKEGGKKIRSCSLYVDNNPVEKKLCKVAEEYRWNFLAYYDNPYPFSSPITIRNASFHLRQAIKLVKSLSKASKSLNYATQRTLFTKLDENEKEQLTDYIIQLYNVIDYSLMDNYFGSMDAFLISAHANTGNEYDMEEYWDKYSYKLFFKMIEITDKMGYEGQKRQFFKLTEEELARVIQHLYAKTKAPETMIAMFLHIDIKQVIYLLNYRITL